LTNTKPLSYLLNAILGISKFTWTRNKQQILICNGEFAMESGKEIIRWEQGQGVQSLSLCGCLLLSKASFGGL
jgi:hypothetical protein